MKGDFQIPEVLLYYGTEEEGNTHALALSPKAVHQDLHPLLIPAVLMGFKRNSVE